MSLLLAVFSVVTYSQDMPFSFGSLNIMNGRENGMIKYMRSDTQLKQNKNIEKYIYHFNQLEVS